MRRHVWMYFSVVLTILFVVSPGVCSAEKDKKAAARQAKIDYDEAQQQIEALQNQQIGAGTVQDETSVQMKQRMEKLQELEKKLEDAQRRMQDAGC